MKKLIFTFLIMFPTLSFAQLNDDGKTFEKVSSKQNNYAKANSIILSGSLSLLSGSPPNKFFPGIKYQYCKSFGAYISFKSNFAKRDSLGGLKRNITLMTLGATKSLGPKVNIYLGGGIEISSSSYNPKLNLIFGVIEAGCVLKIGIFAIDLGGACSFYTNFYSTLGIGFNF
jgi:hypothetical protein